MQTVFLKDGTQANLVAKTDNGYVVDPLETYTDYETKEEYTEPSGKVKLVDKVYETAPIEVVEEEYKQVLEKIREQKNIIHTVNQELSEARAEIAKLKSTKTDFNRWIINREEIRNAKKLIVWPQDEIAPRIMDGTKGHKFSISYEVSQFKNEERVWVCKPSFEDQREHGWSNYTQYFDGVYGVKVDLSEEEIIKLTHERLPRFKVQYHSWQSALLRTDDKWLTPEFIELKNTAKENERKRSLENAEKELKAAQEKLAKLHIELAVS